MSTYSAFESSQVSLQSDTKYSVRIIRYSGGFRDILGSLFKAMCEENNLKFNSEFNREKYGVSFLSQLVLSL